MLILHPTKPKNSPIDYSKTVAFYLIEPTNFDEKKTIKQLADQLKSILKKCKIDPTRIVINGDGARWMESLKRELNCSLKLDEFHLKQRLKRALSSSFGAIKCMKRLFKIFKQKRVGYASWYAFFNDILTNKTYLDYTQGVAFFYEKVAKYYLTKEQKKALNDIFKYIENNKNAIWDTNQKRLIGSSLTENFIYKTTKKVHINKHATYSLELFKKLMIFNNQSLKIATVFLN